MIQPFFKVEDEVTLKPHETLYFGGKISTKVKYRIVDIYKFNTEFGCYSVILSPTGYKVLESELVEYKQNIFYFALELFRLYSSSILRY
jgi:hypothetical protein